MHNIIIIVYLVPTYTFLLHTNIILLFSLYNQSLINNIGITIVKMKKCEVMPNG